MGELTIGHLRAFLELAQRRSIQAAARATGRSRATYLRILEEIREAFDAPELLQRAPGQRVGVLTPEGEVLARRARTLVEVWEQWLVATHDALEQSRDAVRVGTLPGSFDLIADLLTELRVRRPDLPMRVVEYPDERLVEAMEGGAVDLGFGTLGPEGVPPRLEFETLGPLPWSVILPASMADAFPKRLRLSDLDGVPLVVTRGGPARRRLERYFEEYESGPIVLDPAFEVGSTPRMVEMVGRGFGPALVSRFRLAFLPENVLVRPLLDGPAPLQAGVFTRRGAVLTPAAKELLRTARRRFTELSRIKRRSARP
jgi:DNA-binding transcriptional LysR family regulator